MPGFAQNVYAALRLRHGAVAALRDERSLPPERLLQAVWQHQRLRRECLRTLDGETVRVLHPGFPSGGQGPDFRGAVLQIGTSPAQSGDVEVDVRSNGWRAHGHHRNKAFREVLLHVVWDTERTACFGGRTLALKPVLDAPLAELNLWLDREPICNLPASFRGRCAAPLRQLPEAALIELLEQAARVRLQAKASLLHSRARQVGWEQALWEGLFRAAGYQHNVWPMQCLAETRGAWQRPEDKVITLQSRLLGLSGLLPVELTRRETAADGYLRQVWDRWWRERDELSGSCLPRTVWHLHRQRPANHPQRRLALLAHWLSQADLPGRLEQWCQASVAENALQRSFCEILAVDRDDFWSWHWTLRSPRMVKPQPLLGAARSTDIAINVALPWLWIRAAQGQNVRLCEETERRYSAWPAAEDNSVLRLARQRLLGATTSQFFRRAALQQGLMQIVRDFCDHSNAICDHCGFPELVREWPQGKPGSAPPALPTRGRSG